jgi:hypothetical protein
MYDVKLADFSGRERERERERESTGIDEIKTVRSKLSQTFIAASILRWVNSIELI